MQVKNDWEYFYEIISHFTNDFDISESLFVPYEKNIIVDRVFQLINRTGTRLGYLWSTLVKLEQSNNTSDRDRYNINWQFSDYIWQFILDASGLITQAKDYENIIDKDSASSEELKNMKTVLNYDYRVNFLWILRDAFAHYEKSRNFDFTEFVNYINTFNKSIETEASNFSHPYIGLKENFPKGFAKMNMNISKTVSWVKINGTQENMDEFNKTRNLSLIFEEYDINNDSSEVHELVTKGSIQLREVLFNFDFNSYRPLNDVNNWFVIIQVTDWLGLRILLYPAFYSMLKFMSELMQDELNRQRIKNKKPKE